MSQRRTSKSTWIGTFLVLIALGWFFWYLVGLHVDEPSGPVSGSSAQSFASITIPPQATNIRIAGYRQWIQFERYVRFEAPVAVCLQAAAAIAPGKKLKPVSHDELPFNAGPIRKDVFHDLSCWFDLDRATNVLSAGGGPSDACVWVDVNRGVFYYRVTD